MTVVRLVVGVVVVRSWRGGEERESESFVLYMERWRGSGRRAGTLVNLHKG